MNSANEVNNGSENRGGGEREEKEEEEEEEDFDGYMNQHWTGHQINAHFCSTVYHTKLYMRWTSIYNEIM